MTMSRGGDIGVWRLQRLWTKQNSVEAQPEALGVHLFFVGRPSCDAFGHPSARHCSLGVGVSMDRHEVIQRLDSPGHVLPASVVAATVGDMCVYIWMLYYAVVVPWLGCLYEPCTRQRRYHEPRGLTLALLNFWRQGCTTQQR